VTSPRTPRQWNAGDAEPEDRPVLRDHAPGAGFTWETPIQREGMWGNDYGQWMPWAKVLEHYGPLSEVLPETPEPPRDLQAEATRWAVGQALARGEEIEIPGMGIVALDEEPVPSQLDEEDPVPASQSVPAVPVSSTGGKETGEEAETATEALSGDTEWALSDPKTELTKTLAEAAAIPQAEAAKVAAFLIDEESWRPPLPVCDCEPFAACPHIEQADPNEQAAIQLGYCEASVQASADPEDGEQCPNLREPGYVNCHLHRSSLLPDSETEWGIRPVGQGEVEETGAEEWARAVSARMPTLYVTVSRRAAGPWIEATS